MVCDDGVAGCSALIVLHNGRTATDKCQYTTDSRHDRPRGWPCGVDYLAVPAGLGFAIVELVSQRRDLSIRRKSQPRQLRKPCRLAGLDVLIHSVGESSPMSAAPKTIEYCVAATFRDRPIVAPPRLSKHLARQLASAPTPIDRGTRYTHRLRSAKLDGCQLKAANLW